MFDYEHKLFFVKPREAFPIAQYRGHEIDAPVIQKRSLHRPAEGNSINGIYLFFFIIIAQKKITTYSIMKIEELSSNRLIFTTKT